jgi:hypothetical protein
MHEFTDMTENWKAGTGREDATAPTAPNPISILGATNATNATP